jgi:hypothetical protein
MNEEDEISKMTEFILRTLPTPYKDGYRNFTNTHYSINDWSICFNIGVPPRIRVTFGNWIFDEENGKARILTNRPDKFVLINVSQIFLIAPHGGNNDNEEEIHFYDEFGAKDYWFPIRFPSDVDRTDSNGVYLEMTIDKFVPVCVRTILGHMQGSLFK